MTNEEAVRELAIISYGSLANLTGLKTYSEIDAFMDPLFDMLLNGEVDVSKCETWVDVWNAVVPPKFRTDR